MLELRPKGCKGFQKVERNSIRKRIIVEINICAGNSGEN